MASLDRKVVNTADAPQPLGAYSQAVRVKAAELVYVAGQVAVDAAGELVGSGDVAAQTRQVFQNLGQVLNAAGATFSSPAPGGIFPGSQGKSGRAGLRCGPGGCGRGG